LVGLLVPAVLVGTGLASAAEALSGFGHPAVVTVWAMAMLGAGLAETGLAGLVGRQVLGLAGGGEARSVAVVMGAAAVLSAFMNNLAVAAVLFPVVVDLGRRSGAPPSKLLMPLAFGSLLGGATTLIGTPQNVVASELLREAGAPPVGLLDFGRVGAPVAIAGIAFVALVGRRWLGSRDPAEELARAGQAALGGAAAHHERTAVLRVGAGSPLAGRSLRETRLGSATGLDVIAVFRGDRTKAAPSPEFVLEAEDRLLVEGRLDRFEELQGWRELVVEEPRVGVEQLISGEIELGELRVSLGSALVGQSIGQADLRNRFGVIVLALRRGSTVLHTGLAQETLEPTDRLLVHGRRGDLAALARWADLEPGRAPREELERVYELGDRLFTVRIPPNSVLRFKSLARSRLGDALGLGVLGIVRGARTILLPAPDDRLLADDQLIVRGRPEDLEIFRGLQALAIEGEGRNGIERLESERIGMVAAVLAPGTALEGRSLREVRFRERYGLQAVGIVSGTTAPRASLREARVRTGDTLLLLGPRDRIALLAREPGFIVLGHGSQEAGQFRRAPAAAVILGGVLAAVFGGAPVSVAAATGAALMVLTGCVSLDGAYRSIPWRVVFPIAGLLPLASIMERTGAAGVLGGPLAESITTLGPWVTLALVAIASAVAGALVPAGAFVVLAAPAVLAGAGEAGLRPATAMMAITLAASWSFASPMAQPATLLAMGAGGYTLRDYLRVGLPLAALAVVVTLLLLPIAWPLG
jgi:di/tricarboxylate transporter